MPGDKDVVAVDLATRSMTARDAAATVERAVRALRGADLLFKTVDSTLRGHVRAEIEAAARSSGRSRIVFAPAFPDAGRTTHDGVQYVDGLPVSQSRYGDDPVHPARSSRLSDLLPSAAEPAAILDVETQAGLDAQVAVCPDPSATLWVGSPGLAIALSRRIAPHGTPPETPCADGDVLIVVGSANRISIAQADAAAAVDGTTVLRAPVGRGDPAATLADLTERAVSALETGRFGSLLATGGDTMEAILDALGITAFDLTGEIEPGFPTARAPHRGRSLVLGMKAGGFGDPDTLARAAGRFLQSKVPLS